MAEGEKGISNGIIWVCSPSLPHVRLTVCTRLKAPGNSQHRGWQLARCAPSHRRHVLKPCCPVFVIVMS